MAATEIDTGGKTLSLRDACAIGWQLWRLAGGDPGLRQIADRVRPLRPRPQRPARVGGGDGDHGPAGHPRAVRRAAAAVRAAAAGRRPVFGERAVRGRAVRRDLRPVRADPIDVRAPAQRVVLRGDGGIAGRVLHDGAGWRTGSEEHTSELQSLMRISYAVFCLKTK